ncbi:MAG: glycerol-3-phosphate responsive antiterminator [Candidatus Limnocylindrales bacterium]
MSVAVARRPPTAWEFLARIAHARCCAAITVDQKLDAAIASRAQAMFVLRGNGLDLAPVVHRIHDEGKFVAVHLDLIAGLRADRAGVAWLARSGVDAIISSHGQLMPAIKQEGVIAIQRLLLVRQNQMHAAVAAISRSRPDIVEILPGVILPDIVHLLPKFNVPLLAGGFIRTEAEARAAVAAGAIGVTTSWPPLWDVIID